MTDYSRAKKLHPNLKVRNAKALIAEIRRAEPSPGFFTHPPARKKNGDPVRPHMLRTDGKLMRSGEKYPIYFDMCQWFRELDSNQKGDDSVCGTVAGFAFVLKNRQDAKRGKRPRVASVPAFTKRAAHSDSGVWGTMVGALEEFLGVDAATATMMSSIYGARRRCVDDSNDDVEPRHAVAMLEHFLETGEVDWNRAMGRKRDGRLTNAEWLKRCEAVRIMEALKEEARGLKAA